MKAGSHGSVQHKSINMKRLEEKKKTLSDRSRKWLLSLSLSLSFLICIYFLYLQPIHMFKAFLLGKIAEVTHVSRRPTDSSTPPNKLDLTRRVVWVDEISSLFSAVVSHAEAFTTTRPFNYHFFSFFFFFLVLRCRRKGTVMSQCA